MGSYIGMLLNPKALISGGAIGLIVLTIYVGPQLGLSWLLIGIIIAAILAIWITILVVTKLKANKAAKDLEDSLNQQAEDQIQTARPGREAEIEKLRDNLSEAVTALKTSKVGKAAGGSALYVLPWYMIIGPPASGKTTLLSNSGLNFPYLDPTRNRPSVRGVGGTRNCDWWFSDEAVILDTAGRYTLPVEADDSKEWIEFLKLLRDKRGKKPINGLLVGVSIQDLLSGETENVEQHASKIRSRIDELIENLSISFPIYLVFTKCDLIRGFVEFFGDLSKNERAEVWGATFARDRINHESAAQMFDAEMDGLTTALRSSRIPRLAQEAGAENRPDILFFPLQFEALRRRLSIFIETLFKENPYQEKPIFRGFYFTSGTQEGRPIDQVINAMLTGFGVDKTEEGMYLEPTQTKSYFIENAFSKVMFPDRHIAGPSLERERKKRGRRVKVFAAGSLGLVALFVGMFFLSNLNRQLLKDVRDVGDESAAIAESQSQELSLENLKTIDRFRGKLEEMERKGASVSKALLLGTFQADKALDDGRRLYLGVFNKAILQPSEPHFVRNLRSHEDSLGVSFDQYYQWYRTWRIVLDPGERLKPKDVPSVASQLSDFWEQRAADIDTDNQQKEYRDLMENQVSFASRYPSLMAELQVAPRDSDVQDQLFKAAVRRYWNADTVYPALSNLEVNVEDISVASILKGNLGVAGNVAVPGLYTKEAWEGPVKEFLDRLDGYREDWSLQRAYSSDPPSLRTQLVARHSDEYINHWTNFLGGVAVTIDKDGTKDFLERSSKEGAPLLKILRQVKDNTAFAASDPDLEPVANAFAPVEEFFQKPGVNPFRFLRKSENDVVLQEEYIEKVKAVADGYSPDGGDSGPISDLQSWVRIQIPEDQANSVTTELSRLLQLPASSVSGVQKKAAAGEVNEAWSDLVREFNETMRGKYPFANASRAVSLNDFESFFGNGGKIQSFYDEQLSGLASEDGTPRSDAAVKISGSMSAFLRKAYRIRRTMFAGGGGPDFSFSLQASGGRAPAGSGLSVRQMRFEMGGEELSWQAGQRIPVEFQWPGSQASKGASVRLTARKGSDTITFEPKEARGEWGLFRLVDQAKTSGSGGKVTMQWTLDSDESPMDVVFEAKVPGYNPFASGFFRISIPSKATQ